MGKKERSHDSKTFTKAGKKEAATHLLPTAGEFLEHDGRFTILVQALQAAGLWKTATNPNLEPAVTLFAPPDAALAQVGEEALMALLNDSNDQSTALLLYHVVPCPIILSTLQKHFHASSRVTLATSLAAHAQMPEATIDVIFRDHEHHHTDDAIYVQGRGNNPQKQPKPKIVAADILASNGVVHVIDQVLLPPPKPELPTLVELAKAYGVNTMLTYFAQTNGLCSVNDPNDPPFTIVAPTDQAFQQLDSYFLSYLIAHPFTFVLLLIYHATPGFVSSTDLMAYADARADVPTQLPGETYTVEVDGDFIFLKGKNNDPSDHQHLPRLIKTDLMAANGILHVIDRVLVPLLPIGATLALKGLQLLNEALDLGDLSDTLNEIGLNQNGDSQGDPLFPFTVFAPTNMAMEPYSPSIPDMPKDVLQSILSLHVIPQKVINSATLVSMLQENNGSMTVKTLGGNSLEITGTDLASGITVAGPGNALAGITSKIVTVDIPALNGVIHLIDTVLMPPQP